ncbi:MAG: PrsW family intramembrane metalloprotease [Armatimonadetes bacterium]|nr:PrsW family intramembrane metalloprotease [Armatimonadota bacterium]
MEGIFVVCGLPALVLLLFFYLQDKYAPEPLRLIVVCAIFGAFLNWPVALLQHFCKGILGDLGEVSSWHVLSYTFFAAALVEEGLIFFVIRFLPYRSRHFNEPFDGIIYAVAVAVGFASTENLVSLLVNGLDAGLWRSVLTVPMHVLTAACMGFFLGKAKAARSLGEDRPFLWIGFLLALVFHGTGEFLILTEMIPTAAISLPLIGLLWALVFVYIRGSQVRSPFRNGG